MTASSGSSLQLQPRFVHVCYLHTCYLMNRREILATSKYILILFIRTGTAFRKIFLVMRNSRKPSHMDHLEDLPVTVKQCGKLIRRKKPASTRGSFSWDEMLLAAMVTNVMFHLIPSSLTCFPFQAPYTQVPS